MLNTTVPLVARGGLLVAAAVVLGGCVTPQPAQVGIVKQVVSAEAGESTVNSTPDFIFRSETGVLRRFSESRGDITILAFPKSEDWPDCGRCCQLQRLAHRLRRVQTDVTVISVFVPEDSCEERHRELKRCEIEGYAELIALCDSHGEVRKLYGPHAKGRFFIIDENGRHVGTGDLGDVHAIEDCVRRAVYEHEAYCNRLYGPQEIDWPY